MITAAQTISLSEAEHPLYVGIDVGGTNIKFGLIDDLGRTLAKTSIPTDPDRGADDAVVRMADAIERLLDETGAGADAVRAVGLATPGTMDIPAGMLLEPPNLRAWGNFPIRDRLSDACGKPVAFANDAGAAAYGEYWVGSGAQYESLVLLTLGTGVGGGIIIGDLSIDGQHSHGAEVGHIIIDYGDDARVCSCGKSGHLEAYASATAVVKRIEEALADGQETSLRARADAGEKLTTLMLAREAEKGDALANELILDTARLLGVGVVSLMHTVDPAAVVLGGAMTFGGNASPLGRRFIDRVRQEVARRAFPALVGTTTVDFASLGGDAGYIGAAGVARATFPAGCEV